VRATNPRLREEPSAGCIGDPFALMNIWAAITAFGLALGGRAERSGRSCGVSRRSDFVDACTGVLAGSLEFDVRAPANPGDCHRASISRADAELLARHVAARRRCGAATRRRTRRLRRARSRRQRGPGGRFDSRTGPTLGRVEASSARERASKEDERPRIPVAPARSFGEAGEQRPRRGRPGVEPERASLETSARLIVPKVESVALEGPASARCATSRSGHGRD